MQLDLIPQESYISFGLYSSERLMASPLFRIHDSELAVRKTGSNEIVGLKIKGKAAELQ